MKITKFIFIALVLSIFVSIYLFSSQTLAAQTPETNLTGRLEKNGRISLDRVNNQPNHLKPHQKIILGLESDRIQLKVVDEPEVNIKKAQVVIDVGKFSPSEIDSISIKSYGIHGVLSTTQNKNGAKLIFEAINIYEKGIWTIEIILPKGIIQPNLWQKTLFWSANSSIPWFTVSLSLIFIINGIIAYLLYRRRKLESLPPSEAILTAPPTDLSSAAVAILEEKKAAQRAIAAGILYLAARGFLTVIKKDGGFLVAKHKEPGELDGIDRNFYNLLIGNWFAQSTREIKIETSRDLFNQAAGEIHKELYSELSQRGLFVEDPWLTIHKARILGIVIFFISMIGFFVSLFILPYPPFASFLWVAFMIMSQIIVKIATLIPLRSPKGAKERQAWHDFRRFLSQDSPASEIDLSMDIYLHYAIALRCENQWIMRFSKNAYRVPAWYVGPSVTVEDIANDIVAFVNEFSRVIDEGIPPELA